MNFQCFYTFFYHIRDHLSLIFNIVGVCDINFPVIILSPHFRKYQNHINCVRSESNLYIHSCYGFPYSSITPSYVSIVLTPFIKKYFTYIFWYLCSCRNFILQNSFSATTLPLLLLLFSVYFYSLFIQSAFCYSFHFCTLLQLPH